MTVRLYRSQDTGAPSLTGQSGSLIAVLDACLVNGYGSMPAAGWTKPFSGTNLAAYRASIGTRYYLRVNDSLNTGSYSVTAFETMSDVNTGTNIFPNTSQEATGLVMLKSGTSNATARSWAVIAHERSFFLFSMIDTSTTFTWERSASPTNYNVNLFFGEIYSFAAADPYNCYLMGTLSSAAQSVPSTGALAVAGNYIARNFSGSVISHSGSRFSPGQTSSSPIYTEFGDLVSGQASMYPSLILETSPTPVTSIVRGRHPLYFSTHDANYAFQPSSRGALIDGAGAYAGRQFISVTIESNTTISVAYIELTDNWYNP